MLQTGYLAQILIRRAPPAFLVRLWPDTISLSVCNPDILNIKLICIQSRISGLHTR